MKVKHFINLTNGIQAIQDYNLTDISFIRIKSTQCEQKRWEEIIFTISDDFLMNVAIGNQCIVYDYGANKEVPRAIWQGLEWIKSVLHWQWRGGDYSPTGRARTAHNYFHKEYCLLDNKTKRRLDYFSQYYQGGPILISAINSNTKNDGHKTYYQNIIKEYTKNPLDSTH